MCSVARVNSRISSCHSNGDQAWAAVDALANCVLTADKRRKLEQGNRDVKDRLENLRLYFPAEVTAAYLAVQKLLAANGVLETERMWLMVGIALALAAINAVVYWKFYEVDGPVWILVLTAGFVAWVLNIDMPRYKDLPVFGEYLEIEIAAPILLVFYTLITSFFELPKRKNNAKPKSGQ